MRYAFFDSASIYKKSQQGERNFVPKDFSFLQPWPYNDRTNK